MAEADENAPGAASAAAMEESTISRGEFMQVVDQVAKNVPNSAVGDTRPFQLYAWGCLRRDRFPRRQCIAIVSDYRFDWLVLGLIGLNCVTMTIFASPIIKSMISEEFGGGGFTTLDVQAKSLWASKHWTFSLLRPVYDCNTNDLAPCSIEQIVDLIFLILFSVEMVIKMIAYGAWKNKQAYFRVGWNWLDFVVVVVGWLEFGAGSALPAINTIRLVKTLRPLRSMQRIRGLRVLVQCILEALPQMGNVAVFLIFTLVLFGLFGHAFFKGRLRHECHWESSPGVWESTGEICDAECVFNDATLLLSKACLSLGADTKGMESHAKAGIWSYSCRPGMRCLCSSGEDNAHCTYLNNPNYGITSFDSLLWAMLSLFQAISLEGWVDMMYQLMDGGSDFGSIFVVFYFILLVLFGAIIVMNLFLAVLCDNFEMAEIEADKEGIEKDDDQDMEVYTQQQMQLIVHKNKFRQGCLVLVKWKPFDYFIQGCILFNTLIMCLKVSPYPATLLSNDLVVFYGAGAIPAGVAQWDYLPYGYFWFLGSMNIALTAIFTIECIVKVVGLGPKLYKADSMNIFDAFVVLFSIIEIILDLNSRFSVDSEPFPIPLSVLRSFRIFRLFKLVRSVESLRKIISTLGSSLKSCVFLVMLLGLIILIFILLGMELFGGRYPHPEYNYTSDNFEKTFAAYSISAWDGPDPSRYNFDDFGSALLSIFVVLSGENWNEVMFDSHTATWDYDTSRPIYLPFAIIYFIALFIIGNLLLFNLFIAILLANFEKDDEEEEEGEEVDDMVSSGKKEVAGNKESTMEWTFGQYRESRVATAGRKSGQDETATTVQDGADEEEAKPSDLSKGCPKDSKEGNGDMSCKIFSWNNPVRQMCASIVRNKWFEPLVLSLILLSTLALIIDMPYYSKDSPFRTGIKWVNVVFTVLFTIEMLLKICAQGFLFSKTPKHFALSEAYLRSGWNILDFLIVIISLISLIPTGVDFLQQLRAFRAIRPMRLVSRYESLKITFQTLLKSIPAMGSLIAVALLFFFIFAILGLELFGGKMGRCYDPLFGGDEFGSRVIPGMNGAQNDYVECMKLPRYNLSRTTTDGILFMDMADEVLARTGKPASPDWLEFTEFPQWMYPQFGSFDDIGSALMLLFEVSALEGWPNVMHLCMDCDQREMLVVPWRIDTNPIYWIDSDDWSKSAPPGITPLPGTPTDTHVTSNNEAGTFFILWIIFGCFVIINMTIGVVVDTFSDIKAENDGLLLMSEDAADWVKAQKQVLAQRPLRAAEQPESPWRLNFFYLVTSTKFEILVMVVIMANMLQMGLDWWEPAVNAPYMPDLKRAMSIINIFFFVLYVIEMLLKWVGIGVVQYFKNWWNCFDFCLVIISLVDIIFSPPVGNSELPFPAAVLRVLRLFRVARILRIVRTAKQLRTIMMTVYISVPQLKNIILLMVLIIIIVDMLLVGFYAHVNYTPGNYDFMDHTIDNFNQTESYLRGERYSADDWHFDSTQGTNWGDQINRHANFAFFWTGLLTLVRSSTGESFNSIMHDLYSWTWGHNRMTCCFECGPILDGDIQTNFYVASLNVTLPAREQPTSSCGNSYFAWPIYFLFQMTMAYIVLSIMIGIILENFANVGSETKKISLEDIEDFREVWLKYDPKGTFIVPSHNLLAILQQLKEPLGIQGMSPPLTRAEMLMHLGKLDIPDHKGYIHFMETLTAVSNAHAGVPVPVCDTTTKMAKSAMQVPKLKQLEHPAHNALTNYLVSLLQSRWRGYAMRRKYTDDEGNPQTEMDADAAQSYEPAPPPQKVKANQVAPASAQ